MAKRLDQFYWDSCVFISAISDDAKHPTRRPVVEGLLARAEAGEFAILTSAVTIAEVAFAADERSTGRLDAATEARIDKLWVPGGPVRVVEYTRSIGVQARALIREAKVAGRSLKPMDAIHLATALLREVDQMHSYDGPLTRYSEAAPKLAACEPSGLPLPAPESHPTLPMFERGGGSGP